MRLILLSLLLAGCATTKIPESYGTGPLNDDNCCTIIGDRLYHTDTATPEEIAAWWEYHLEPSLDECEKKALTRHRWSAIGDSVSTIAVLGLCSAIEANPIIAAVPGGWAIIPLSYGVYRLDKYQKSQTSRYWENNPDDKNCGIDPTDVAVGVRSAVVFWNVSLLAQCL